MKYALINCAFVALVAACTRQLYAEQRAVPIVSAQDVLSQWRHDQHLYVKGDIGVSRDQLTGLESWLDENGPHWVIVLMEDADQESYRAADGRTYYHLDAVEHALGHGLSNRTSFGQWEDARTRESDGTVFVLFLKERKFSYFGSDAQDRRGLGESHWIGELDQPAFRAMSSGMRITDAVKDTVNTINRLLQQTIDREEEARLKEQRERKLAVNELIVRISSIGEDIAEVRQLAGEFRSDHPEAIGELTEPPLQDWEDELLGCEEQLTEETVYEVSQKATSLADRVAEYLNAYAAEATYGQRVAALEERLSRLASKHDGVAQPTVAEARRLIQQAAEDQSAGRFEFIQRFQDASSLADRAAAEVQAETARLARLQRLRGVIRQTALVTGVLILGGLGALGLMLNRRRRPVMERARTVFEQRKQSVANEVDRVFQLFERSGEVLGSKDRVEDRGYEGRTRELSHRTFDSVDDLLVMSSEVERVMGEAESLIHPTNPLAKTLNAFSGSRFTRGIDRISGKPLEFERDKGLPLALDEDDEVHRAAEQTAGDGRPPETIQLTFEEVFARFHDRSVRATETLDRIESCLLRVNDGLDELQAELEQLSVAERELAEKAQENDYFDVPAFFARLIPSAQMDFDAADAVSGSDPVAAVEAHLPEGDRKVKQAMTLTTAIRRAHSQLLPQLRETAPQLEEAGYETAWIDERLMEMTQQADQLFAQAARQSVAESAAAFDRGIDELSARCTRCVEIAGQLKAELEPSVERLQLSTDDARRRIGNQLRLPAEDLLHETPRDPDDNLASARRQIDAMQAALHRGNVEAASEAATLLQREVQDGNQSIQETMTSLEHFDSIWRTREEEIKDTRDKLPRYQTLMAAARAEYAANTFVLQAVDPTFPEAEATIDSHWDACRSHVAEVERLHGLSREFFEKGRILEATAMLEAIHDDLAVTNQNYKDLDEHVRSLEQLSRDNAATLAQLVAQGDHLRHDVNEQRTTRSAVELFQQSDQEMQVVVHEVESRASARDPLGTAQRLKKLRVGLEEVDARIEADRNAHAEAQRACESAVSQVTAGRRLIQRTRQDGIPDSRTTGTLVREIEGFDAQLREVQRRLSVPHEDWQLVHDAAVAVQQKLGRAAGELVGELQLAGQAAELLERASRDLFQTTKWTGGWGVRIFGAPGSQELERARAALQGADYKSAIEFSRAASLIAGQAIQKAQREVARRQRDELRRAEARRRQRSISSGGASQGSSGGSRRISGGRSQSRSTSGFNRSGW